MSLTPCHPRILVGIAVAMLFVVLASALLPDRALAHANLETTEPPVDGLVVSSPEVITMTFTEDVATSPAPSVAILDQQGASIPESKTSVAIGDTPRTLEVTVPDLAPGTWTVSWQVTSATDGHTLSGAWAFRVGGGLPPGLATTEDASPPVWAVTLRWLTFLGAASAAGILLFPWFLKRMPSTDDNEVHAGASPGDSIMGTPIRVTPREIRFALFAGIVALCATLLEPAGAWLTDRSASLGSHISALPDDWMWRPATLAPFVIIALGILISRRSLQRPVATGIAILPLASLLGLILTSHAAGRADFRTLAIASNALHQWSVALWVGGLIAFGLWLISKRSSQHLSTSVGFGRFSSSALILVVVAVITGIANTGFMLPIVSAIRDDGWTVDAFSDLWTSRYGIILLIKALLLVVPLALAAYHRNVIGRHVRNAGSALASLPGRMNSTLRWEVAAVIVVVAGGSTLALSSPPATIETDLDRITLVAPTSFDPADGSFLVHLTVDPAQAAENKLTVQLTDWNGADLPADPEPRVSLAFTSLDHGARNGGVTLEPSPDEPETFSTSGLNLSLEGWWQITATVSRTGDQNAFATFNILLPDPNTNGSDEAPRPKSDPEAEALFDRALARMTSWESVRWTELIGSGLDVLVWGDFAVVDRPEQGPSSYSMGIEYSGSFADTPSGNPPAAPSFDARRSVSVGDQGWLRTTDDVWLEEPPTRYIPPSGWGDQYEGSTNFRMGITQEIDGVDAQVITFFLPEQVSQSQAWFAWWIDPETGDVLKVAMTARLHYMTWTYSDVNGDFTITPPVTPESSAG